MMKPPPAPSASQNPEAYKAWIREGGRTLIPALLGHPPLRPWYAPSGPGPATPLPDTDDIARKPTQQLDEPGQVAHTISDRLVETGGIPRLRETAVLSAVRQLRDVISVRDTKELIHAALTWFLEKHGFLPYAIKLSPVRYLAITKSQAERFPVEGYEDRGWYTVEVECNQTLTMDAVELTGGHWFWEVVTDFYLCVYQSLQFSAFVFSIAQGESLAHEAGGMRTLHAHPNQEEVVCRGIATLW